MAKFFPLRFFSDNPKIDFMKWHHAAFMLSGLAILGTIILVLTNGLNFGIDFSGGIVIEAKLPVSADLSSIRSDLDSLNLGEIALQSFGSERDIMIRLQKQEGNQAEQMKAVDKVKNALEKIVEGTVDYRKVDFVGPQVGSELLQGSILAMLLSFVGIMVYLWFRFEWQFGLGAILALIHDAAVTVGFFAVTGLEFNLTSVASILTIIGYSVNDSVVIYDRIRENLRKYKKMPLDELINLSLNATLSRTILTVSTTVVALLALVFAGGNVLYGFSLSMLFGIVIGTYSSIYISAPILIYMNIRKQAAVA